MALFIRHVRAVLFTGLIVSLATSARAQDPQQQPPPTPPPASSTQQQPPPTPTPTPTATPTPTPTPDANDKNRIFGVIPNYTSVEGTGEIKPITSGESFKMAALDSFDPMVYPLFGFIAGVSQIQNQPESFGQTWSGYAKRYGLAFADNSVCSLVTTGLMPSIFKQDPRYTRDAKRGSSIDWAMRPAAASSRNRDRATRSSTSPKSAARSSSPASATCTTRRKSARPSATLERWGMQAMWDSFANELKEFWPDIRKVMHGW